MYFAATNLPYFFQLCNTVVWFVVTEGAFFALAVRDGVLDVPLVGFAYTLVISATLGGFLLCLPKESPPHPERKSALVRILRAPRPLIGNTLNERRYP